jgi:7-cyano-7-deazaguanine synthase in queuosine biosynthesis
MSRELDHFGILVRNDRRSEERAFVGGKDFRLTCRAVTSYLRTPLSDRMVDMLRIASTVYFADRIIRRDRSRGCEGWPRNITCSLGLRDIRFWEQPNIHTLVEETIGFVSGDKWNLRLSSDTSNPNPHSHRLQLSDTPPLVFLYSGGLDSAAGLACRLGNGIDRPLLPVVVRHRSDIGKATLKQLNVLGDYFHTDLRPLIIPLSMKRPKRLWAEESSQRARSFLFVAVGGVVAWVTNSGSLEVFESGIGAINAPLLAGMEGSQATRSCHPVFLEKMSRLLSIAAERPINVVLPFKDYTKGEIVRGLSGQRLHDIARSTISCANIHCAAIDKSCGFCPACIFRRLAFHAARIEESGGSYEYDLLSPAFGHIAPRRLQYLSAFLLMVDHLAELDERRLPIVVSRHLRQTGIVKDEKQMQLYIDLYQRYRGEWWSFLKTAKASGCSWGDQVDLPTEAA